MNKLKVFTDGASRNNPGESGIGIIIYDENNSVLKKWNEYIGKATNNQAEYKALIKSISLIEEIISGAEAAPEFIEFNSDSELMVNQLKSKYRVKDAGMLLLYRLFLQEVKKLGIGYSVSHIDRKLNKEADKLANQAIDNKNSL